MVSAERTQITDVMAREILDSRGNPTVEVEVQLVRVAEAHVAVVAEAIAVAVWAEGRGRRVHRIPAAS